MREVENHFVEVNKMVLKKAENCRTLVCVVQKVHKDKELYGSSVVKESLTTASETKPVEFEGFARQLPRKTRQFVGLEKCSK